MLILGMLSCKLAWPSPFVLFAHIGGKFCLGSPDASAGNIGTQARCAPVYLLGLPDL